MRLRDDWQVRAHHASYPVMSERNRYRVMVCYENIVYADNPAEAEQFGIEECEQGHWQIVAVDVDPAPARDPADDIDRRNGTQ